MNATKEWGDVASKSSLAQYLGCHLMHHADVESVRFSDDARGAYAVASMLDGSRVTVRVSSNYRARAVHGARSRYNSGCRCESCRQANAAFMRARRKRSKERVSR